MLLKAWAVIGLIIVALVIVATMSTGKDKDINKRMAQLRKIKKQKAEARKKSKVTYTPPAKHEGGLMKVA